MLHAFIAANRTKIITRYARRLPREPKPGADKVVFENGVRGFLDQLVDARHLTIDHDPAAVATATLFSNTLLRGGFTIAQVVHAYGEMCQTITELARETGARITGLEFQTLASYLDMSIAAAVAEYDRLREHEQTARVGRFSHELRNHLNRASLALEALTTESLGVGGRATTVLARSLIGLGNLIDREIATVRLDAEVHHLERLVVRELVDDVADAVAMEAKARRVHLVVGEIERDVAVRADRQVLSSVVANLLQNGIKFTRATGRVGLRVRATSDRVFIDVEDECGGLSIDQEQLFRPFQQHGFDRTGLGLGLDICARGARVHDGEIHVSNHPGTGCVFTLDLPRHATT